MSIDKNIQKIQDIVKRHPDWLSEESKMDFRIKLRDLPSITNEYIANLLGEIAENMDKEAKPVPISRVHKRRKFKPKNPNDKYPDTKLVNLKSGMKAVLLNVKITKLFPPDIFWSCYECTRKRSRGKKWTYDTIIIPDNPCPSCGRIYNTCPTCGTKHVVIRGVCNTCRRIWYQNKIVMRFHIEDDTGRHLVKILGDKAVSFYDGGNTMDLVRLVLKREVDLNKLIGNKYDMAGDVVIGKRGNKIFRPIWWNQINGLVSNDK